MQESRGAQIVAVVDIDIVNDPFSILRMTIVQQADHRTMNIVVDTVAIPVDPDPIRNWRSGPWQTTDGGSLER